MASLWISGSCSTSTSPLSSSSISVVSVPFEVTGEGPTMSLGLKALGTAGDDLRSIEWGWRDDSPELRAELSKM